MSLLIKNAYIAGPDGAFYGDLLAQGEKIVQVGGEIECDGAEVFDASGRFLLPGGVDPHTHVGFAMDECRVSDDFAAATRAALLGGTTTIADFPGFYGEGFSLSRAVDETVSSGEGASFVDFGVHLVFQRFNCDIARELPEVVSRGFPTGKVFMAYGCGMSDREIFSLMLKMKEVHGLLFYHCENDAIISGLAAHFRSNLPTHCSCWPQSRPAYCEAEAVGRVLALSRAADVPAYIVHLSTQDALEEVIRARRAGVQVYVETCPQYLTLTEGCYERENGLDFLMAPPLRKSSDCERLWHAVGQGDIDTVGSDHCSFSRADKVRLGFEDIFKAPCGVPGIETRMEILFSEGVMKGRMSLEQFAALTAGNPAAILGFKDKGRLASGADADLVIIDPDRSRTLSVGSLHQRVDYTPYEGMFVRGCVTDVWLRGSRKVADGVLVSCVPSGRLVRRAL